MDDIAAMEVDDIQVDPSFRDQEEQVLWDGLPDPTSSDRESSLRTLATNRHLQQAPKRRPDHFHRREIESARFRGSDSGLELHRGASAADRRWAEAELGHQCGTAIPPHRRSPGFAPGSWPSTETA